jgi:hypothetical protein
LDQSQSRIIEFDQNLHFVSSFETDIFQPQYMWFNPLNELLIFSNSEQSLYKYDLGKQLENVFIDFIQFPHFSGEVISITEGKDGDIGFLTNNPSQIFLFNSMGHFIKVIPVLLEHCLWLEFMNHKWIIFNDSGFYSFPQLSETSTQLPFEIRSIAEKDGIIYALSNDGYFQLNINR